jgi:hypothetical protein
MRRWHVLALGDVASLSIFADMAGYPPAAMENLHDCRGRADLDRLVHQPMGS